MGGEGAAVTVAPAPQGLLDAWAGRLSPFLPRRALLKNRPQGVSSSGFWKCLVEAGLVWWRRGEAAATQCPLGELVLHAACSLGACGRLAPAPAPPQLGMGLCLCALRSKWGETSRSQHQGQEDEALNCEGKKKNLGGCCTSRYLYLA